MTTRISSLLALGLSAALLAAASACKPSVPSESGIKSDIQDKGADALTSGDRSRRNGTSCGPDSLPNSSRQDAIKRVHAALPERLREEFPDAGATFQVVDSDQQCRDIFKAIAKLPDNEAASRVTNYSSCWKKPDVLPGRPTVLFSLDKGGVQELHDNALVMATYAYVEFFIDGFSTERAQSKGSTKASDFIKKFRASRKKLAKAVLNDLEAAGKQDAVTRYKELFGLRSGDLADSVLLQNFVLAEFVDAHYCSDSSRAKLRSSPLTTSSEAFKTFATFFGKAWFD